VSGRDARVVCLAASPGGHLAELQSAAGAFDGWRRIWVTGESRQAEALRAAGEEVRVLPAWGRDPPGPRAFPANLRAAAQAVRAARPRVVATTGAGHVVPFALLARAAGSRLLLVESMARVTDASLSARILAPFARAVVVQWPEMAAVLPRALVCRPALLEAATATATARREAGEGTFVSVGTRPEPFDRLLAMVDRAVSKGVLPGPVVAQSGASGYRPRSFSASGSLSPDEVSRALERARYVVCHGGAAMVAAAIAAGRRPLVLPRDRAAGEHRTEHQAQLVARLAAAGAVAALRDEIGPGDLRTADEPWSEMGIGTEWPSVEAVLSDEAEAALRG
jgi:UDP-N-acetylglucosamine--N-acetylmuramyl-(pentapeptide) pyrophosphoryl-undecaprenol N-acetylglucosamine transferase